MNQSDEHLYVENMDAKVEKLKINKFEDRYRRRFFLKRNV
jgi:hypothetical protein